MSRSAVTHPPASSSLTPLFSPFALTVASLVLVLAWDASKLDLWLAEMMGTPAGFPLRDNWFLVNIMHEGAKWLSWVLAFALIAGIRWPAGFLRRVSLRDRMQLVAALVLSVLAVSILKRASESSCPWDLQVFGGVARYVSHWSLGVLDGGPGKCFPAGHASAAFAFAGGYFALRRSSPAFARAWLVAALAAGLVLGLTQQLRGAHYMSHTLWTGWVCWGVGYALDALLHRKDE